MKRHLITAALPYANGPLHIGHLAGCYLPADIYARYLRSKGEEVLFISGTDEHGVAITMKARNTGLSPQEVVDQYYTVIARSFEEFGISFDHFSRTSRPLHHETARDFFRVLYDKGLFIEQETDQYYDEEAGQFLADRYIIGTCPVCANEGAYGDQCEKCGSALSPLELKNPRSALSGSAPVLRKAKNWFLPMDALAETSEFKEYAKRTGHWRPTVRGQFNSWLKEGLQPRAMTRDLDWGVKVPIEGVEGKVLYVWFDAPIGYISATREYFRERNEEKEWEKWWKDEETSLVHFIGKDNIVFHTIIFPMMLMQHGGYILPSQVPANEFLNLEGRKLSTSRNWAVWLHEYLEAFPGRNDELRYTLTSIAPETKDSDFTWKDYQLKVNSELVAILGNFVNRVMVLCHKYYGGVLPEQTPTAEQTARFKELDAAVGNLRVKTDQYLADFHFRDAQAEWMNIAREGNRLLAETEPWTLWKTDPSQVAAILAKSLELCSQLAVCGAPFVPETAARILTQLNISAEQAAGNQALFGPGHQLGQPFLLFNRIEDSEIEMQIAKLQQEPEEWKVAPQKEMISYEDFSKLDIRVGTILEAVKVPKADKLLQLKVDTGLDKRTIVSGIALHFQPEELVGKQVLVLVNLAPRKLRGIESQGMILMAENGEQLELLQPGNHSIPGSCVS